MLWRARIPSLESLRARKEAVGDIRSPGGAAGAAATAHDMVPEQADTTPRRGSFLASSTVRLIGLWILAGALFKLLEGTPNDLPPVVRDFAFPSDLGLKYKLAIGAELCIVSLALFRPRWGWLAVAAQMAVFVVVLLFTLGEESCGCFGTKVVISPEIMLAIDGTLLVLLLALRPWRIKPGGLHYLGILALWAVGISLPWFFDREVGPGPFVDGQPVEGDYIILEVEKWVGMDAGETPLAQVIDPYTFFPDGRWVLWRATCDECAAHLKEMKETETGERLITLIQIKEKHDTLGNQVVHDFPDGAFVHRAELPDSLEYIIGAPAELDVEAFMITGAREGSEHGHGQEAREAESGETSETED